MGFSDADLKRAVMAVVGDGARQPDAIVAALRNRGIRVPGGPAALRDRLHHLVAEDLSFATVGGGVIHLPTLLEGTSWTVMVDADDADEEFVRVHPQLSPLGWWLISDEVSLVSGAGENLGALHTDGWMLDGEDTDVVLGPDGWLAGMAGGWASVTVVGGNLHWSPCLQPPVATAAQVAAIRTGFDRAASHESVEMLEIGEPTELRYAFGDLPMHEALLAGREAFLLDPIPPLPHLYEAAGLEQRGATIAESGFDWDALRARQQRNRAKANYGLHDQQAEQFLLIVDAYHIVLAGVALDPEGDTGEWAVAVTLAAILEDGAVAAAFWAACAPDPTDAAGMGRFVDAVLAPFPERAPVGVTWLQARYLDLSGEPETARAALEAVVTPDCDHEPALVDLAAFAADAGDAATAHRLLLMTPPANDPNQHEYLADLSEAERLHREVEAFAHRPPPAARRNDPCPCGSGRKYKVCHLGRQRHSLIDRSGWLYLKAERFLLRRRADLPLDLALQMAAAATGADILREVDGSPFIHDLALHEEGVFADFLTARDGMLPDDEALLAAQWALVDRSVFEVRGVDRDRLDLYDIGRGESITVLNTHPSARVGSGSVLIGRPLPVGDSYRSFGGFMVVPRSQVTALLDVIDERDGFELASLIGESFAPPLMHNTDGDDLVMHTLRWRAGNRDAVDRALRAGGMQADDREWRLVRDTANQRDAIIAALRWEAGSLVGEVNSDRRAEELRALIAAAIPGAELVEDDARTFARALAEHDPAHASPSLDPNDPEIRQVMAQIIARYEEQWLDESIPALGGRTPRQAADDPIGREELEQLLASFPSPGPDNAGMMSPDRLRQALGL